MSVVFPVESGPFTPPQSFEVQVVSGGANTTLFYQETVTGYDAAAPATVDLGDVATMFSTTVDADVPVNPVQDQTVNITAHGVTRAGDTSSPSPSAVFSMQGPGPSLFVYDFCGVSNAGGADVTFSFNPPPGQAPGTYTATYTFVPSGIYEAPCQAGATIQLKANLLPPSGP